MSVIQEINQQFMKPKVVNVHSGDTVRVHQRIKEGNKERVQVFQGLVIKTSSSGGHLARILVRRVASGVGVEKSFLLHSPLIVKVEVTKRSKVRRNYLSYMRERTGKSARLTGVGFDRSINEIPEVIEKPSEALTETTEAEVQEDKTLKNQATKEESKEIVEESKDQAPAKEAKPTEN